jgi:hypothetical protein
VQVFNLAPIPVIITIIIMRVKPAPALTFLASLLTARTNTMIRERVPLELDSQALLELVLQQEQEWSMKNVVTTTKLNPAQPAPATRANAVNTTTRNRVRLALPADVANTIAHNLARQVSPADVPTNMTTQHLVPPEPDSPKLIADKPSLVVAPPATVLVSLPAILSLTTTKLAIALDTKV